MKHNAPLEAADYYAKHGRNYAQDCAALTSNPRGVMLSSPCLVVLMKPVRFTEANQWQNLAFSPEDADAWYVHLMVGDMELARLWALELPFLPWLCFQRGLRNGRIHRHSWARFIGLQNFSPK